MDTARMKIPIETDVYKLLLKKSKRFTVKNEITGEIENEYFRVVMELGKYRKHLEIRLPDPEKYSLSAKYRCIILELSLPKYVFGHNGYLLYPSKIPFVLEMLYNEFYRYFGNFTHFSRWRFKRIDLPYNWKFDTEEIASRIIDLARPLRYPQKKLVQYPTGVANKGRYHYLKFYQKQHEFIARGDYKELKEKGFSVLAEQVYELTKGIVRFEVKFEEEVFMTHFEKPFLYFQDISDNEKIERLLQNHINTLFKFADKTGTNNTTAKEKLEATFDKNRAGDLYSLWKLIYSVDPPEQKILKNNYSRWKVYRAKKELLEAGVGIPSFSFSDMSFDFSIPSPLVVNQDIALPALAESDTEEIEISQ